ncbi:hypothetical protein P4S72_25735 [Vibrio sp. PP-XX7]
MVRLSARVPQIYPETDYFQVRIEHRPQCVLYGVNALIKGLFAEIPDFKQKVPQIWDELHSRCKEGASVIPRLGVIDVTS